MEGERQYSFTAGDLNPATRREGETQNEEGEGEEKGRGLFSIGETVMESSSPSLVALGAGTSSADGGGEGDSGADGNNLPPTHVDELRQRRLQRFHSSPASPETDSAALLGEETEAECADLAQQTNKEQ